MPLTTAQCSAFSNFLGTRPYDWHKKISKDRKPFHYLYTGMYRTEMFPLQFGTTNLHERVYVTRPNDPGMWTQFVADPCVGAPCDIPRQYIGHGVDQLRFDRYKRKYQTPVFCLDQLNTVEEGIAKMDAIAEGYKDLPEQIASDFLRVLTLRKAGSVALGGGGIYLCGIQDGSGNPVTLDANDAMFTVAPVASGAPNTANSLFINLNAFGGLTNIPGNSITTTAGLAGAIGQLSMEYLANQQEDLAANGYHMRDWSVEGKFLITCDATTRRRLLVANPALTQMYSSADFAKGGAFYSFGVTQGCGDWLFKEDKTQMRFRFRADLDGKDLNGNNLTNAVWIQQVWPFINVSATYGLKPQFDPMWKQAPIRLYHCYNRDARTVYVGDIGSINDEMKFGMARSFMGQWKWYAPDFFNATDPNTGTVCQFNNDDHGKGYWVGEFDLAEKTVYPEIERLILALGEPQPYVRVPRTNAPNTSPLSGSDYQSLLAYNAQCYDTGGPGGPWVLPPED